MAFGYDDKQLERVKKRQQGSRKLVWIPVGIVVVLLVGGILGLLMLGSAAGLGRMVHAVASRGGVEVGVAGVDVDRSSGILAPMGWKAVFHGVDAKAGGTGPSAHADDITIDVGDLFHAWRGAKPYIFDDVRVSGAEVHVPVQAPLPPAGKAGTSWVIRKLHVLKGHKIAVSEDPPRPGAEITTFDGTFENLRWTEGSHVLSGKGKAHIERMIDADAEADGIDLTDIVMRDGTIGFSGTAKVFGVDTKVTGQFQHMPDKGKLALALEPLPVPVQEVLGGTFGAPDLLEGAFQGKVLVQAGGDRARGEAEVTLDGNVAQARLALASPEAAKALVHFVPTLKVAEDDPEAVLLPDLTGKIHHTSAGVEIERLVYDGPLQTRLRGILAPDPSIVVRNVTQLDYWQKPGRGAVISKTEEGWDVRMATAEELMPPKPPAPAPGSPATPPAPAPGD